MIFKMYVKGKFVLWQPGYYDLLTKIKAKKIQVFEVLIILKRTVTVSHKKFSWNTIIRLCTFGKFYIVKLNYFSEWNVSKHFWLVTVLVISEIKILLVNTENSCISVTHPILGASVHTGCYTCNFLVDIIYALFICM